MKVLGPTTDFPTWGWGKGNENPREINFGGQWDLITELPQDWGNWLLEGTNKTLCTPGPQRKEQCHHWERLSQTCLWVSRSLWRRRGSTVACRGVRGTEYNCACKSPFEGGCHYPYHSLASGQITEREHSPTHQQKIGLKIYWAWPCPSEQDPDSSTAGSSHQEASTSLLSFSIRGQTEWKSQLQKTNQTDHLDHSLV